jgi:hypothetical protein
MSLSTHLGIILIISDKIESQIEKFDYNICPKCKNKTLNQSLLFCSTCGIILEQHFKLCDKYINIYDIFIKNGIEENYFYRPENSKYYIPNFYGYRLNTSEYLFDDKFIEKYISKFKIKEAEVLALLESVFGKIEIKFGILEYYN